MEIFFNVSTIFEYEGSVERKISHICHMIENFFIHETILIFLIEL